MHEVLHTVTRPLLFRYKAIVDEKAGLLSLVTNKPEVKYNYKGSFATILDESLVRALTWRIVYKRIALRILKPLIQKEYREGFVLEWYFYDNLANYERSKMPFPKFYPNLISRVNIESETERWKQDNAQTGNGG